jgi:beta-lactamase class A
MDAIAHGRAVDRESSRRMSALLERQTFNDDIPAGLPPGTRVAHKTGEITNIHHDGAIVYTPTPFVLVILTRSTLSTPASSALIASITRQLYEATR